MKDTISLAPWRRAALVAGAVTLACAASAGIAGAQTMPAAPGDAPPAAAAPPPMPSYAAGEEHIRGRIASIDGKYQITVHDDRGFVDTVTLHDGTVINPTGLRLSPGQSVMVLGHNAGRSFAANEIDTPYGHYGGFAYGYPGYPYARYYGYPAFGVGFRGPGWGVRGWY
jgi:hypothetical protein